MLVVAKPRLGGKTTDIIELALKGDSYIVCMDMREAQKKIDKDTKQWRR